MFAVFVGFFQPAAPVPVRRGVVHWANGFPPTVCVPHPAAAYQIEVLSLDEIVRDVWLHVRASLFSCHGALLSYAASATVFVSIGRSAVYLENWIDLLHFNTHLPLPVEFFGMNLGRFTIDFFKKRTMIKAEIEGQACILPPLLLYQNAAQTERIPLILPLS